MTAAPDLMMQGGIEQFEKHAGSLTPGQRAAVDAWLPQLKTAAPGGQAAAGGAPQCVWCRRRYRGRDAARQVATAWCRSTPPASG